MDYDEVIQNLDLAVLEAYPEFLPAPRDAMLKFLDFLDNYPEIAEAWDWSQGV